MYLADYHTHSDCSPDGRETIARMAEAAVARGLDEICITDHVDTIEWGSTQLRTDSFDWAKAQQQYADAVAQYGQRIQLKLGAELGEAYLSFDCAARLMQDAPPLDFIIGSVHMTRDENGWFDLFYIDGDRDDAYYHAVIDGSDAHVTNHLGCAIPARQELLRDCGFRYFTTFDRMKPSFQAL